MEDMNYQPYPQNPYQPPAKPRKKFSPVILIVAIVAVVAILVGAVVGVLSLTGPKSIAKRAAKAALYEDTGAMADLVVFDTREVLLGSLDEEEFFEYQSDHFGEDIESWKDFYKYARAAAEEEMEDEYGEYKVTYDVTKVKNLSSRRLEEDYSFALNHAEKYGFDRDDISDARIATVKIKIKGEDDTERLTYEVILVRVGLSWKVLTMNDNTDAVPAPTAAGNW